MRSALIRGDLGITAPTDALAKREQKDILYRPGIEPGPSIWQTLIVPLNHRYLCTMLAEHMNYIPRKFNYLHRRLTFNQGQIPKSCEK